MLMDLNKELSGESKALICVQTILVIAWNSNADDQGMFVNVEVYLRHMFIVVALDDHGKPEKGLIPPLVPLFKAQAWESQVQ